MLRSINLSAHTFGVMLIEGGWQRSIVRLLEPHGYRLDGTTQNDAIWVNACLRHCLLTGQCNYS